MIYYVILCIFIKLLQQPIDAIPPGLFKWMWDTDRQLWSSHPSVSHYKNKKIKNSVKPRNHRPDDGKQSFCSSTGFDFQGTNLQCI